MTQKQTPLEAWSRAELIHTVTMMVKIAGWAFALAWAAYIVRFSGFSSILQNFLFGIESATQISEAKAAWGQLGDFLGGTLNPLISALTLIGLLFTVLLQQEAMIQMQKESARGHEALKAQGELSLEAARLQSLAAALEVTTEMHRQAQAAQHVSAIDLLKRKEQLAARILEINDRLNNRPIASVQPTDSASAA